MYVEHLQRQLEARYGAMEKSGSALAKGTARTVKSIAGMIKNVGKKYIDGWKDIPGIQGLLHVGAAIPTVYYAARNYGDGSRDYLWSQEIRNQLPDKDTANVQATRQFAQDRINDWERRSILSKIFWPNYDTYGYYDGWHYARNTGTVRDIMDEISNRATITSPRTGEKVRGRMGPSSTYWHEFLKNYYKPELDRRGQTYSPSFQWYVDAMTK